MEDGCMWYLGASSCLTPSWVRLSETSVLFSFRVFLGSGCDLNSCSVASVWNVVAFGASKLGGYFQCLGGISASGFAY